MKRSRTRARYAASAPGFLATYSSCLLNPGRLGMVACAWAALASCTVRAAADRDDAVARLPEGVEAVWNLEEAHRESTATRERVCINGLWRWQPARSDADAVPEAGWGHFKVPGSWPGITNYMQKDCQTVFAHPSWSDERLGRVTAAWYQRAITVPAEWTGRRFVLEAEYVNSFALVYVDGARVGEIRFPSGQVDLTAACRPGRKYMLSMLVVAMPLQGVMLSYNDTASARQVQGRVARRGLCGDVYLSSTPPGARIDDVRVATSVRHGRIDLDVALEGLAGDSKYVLRAEVLDTGRTVRQFAGEPFRGSDLTDGRIAFSEPWQPEKLWDIHTPENVHELRVFLADADGRPLDAALPVRFGFREFWTDGRDFYLNGTRVFLSSVPLDNAQVGAAWANYEAARESLERLKSFGINFVYTHNYGCQPGDHLGFEEVLRAADDVGMLVAFSQPHFGHYDWEGPHADASNGYARHAAFYVRVAQNHPSVVAYSTSHNATGYGEDMNPDLIDGVYDRRDSWSAGNVRRALRAEAILRKLDPSRVVYHHSSGNLGSMHTTNFYANFVPVQEMSDWFEHWATQGVKPVFTCEYSVPMAWDWTMYRGWYQGRREFGSAVVPWEFCMAEWNAQFFGDRAYRISNEEKRNLRWEAEKFRAGSLWHRWDYPHQVGSRDFLERYPVYAMYFSDNWRAFRTWGLSANSPWDHGHYWILRRGVDKNRKELDVDWRNLQRPGFSPDYVDDRYERMDLAFELSDWTPTIAAEALMRNNRPLLAYLAGKPEAFTSKDHNFYPGETVDKQLVVINNSRETVTCDCRWSLGPPDAVEGTSRLTLPTGEQERIPLRFELPDRLPSGTYELTASVRFSTGQTQEDRFSLHVMPRPAPARVAARIALYDPKGETGKLLDAMGVAYRKVDAATDVARYDALVVGKAALTVGDPAPEVLRVREGLKVLLFEQTPEVLEKRFGFRVATYGLRWVFARVPDHPVLAGIGDENLRDWRGEATIVPPRLEYERSPQFGSAPTVRWCGIPVTRLWRCGNRGNVASVSIEKPPRGDFLPLLDGGYGLQYSPLVEYREGRGMVLFCQMDVTGRTERDPAAETLAANVLDYVVAWQPPPRRKALYVGDPAGKRHLERSGIAPGSYEGGMPADDDVLVVGRGGEAVLAPNARALADWLGRGGHLLALGLDEQQAGAFLPMEVKMTKAEHIATYFEPFARGSLLAGVGPADAHNPVPRELPLVSGDAAAGNGVLGKTPEANVVFYQLPPYAVSRAEGALPSLAITDDQAVDGTHSALVTLGTVPWAQLGQKVEAGQVGKTYTFAVRVKSVNEPVAARLEVERAASPWDRAVRGEEVSFGPDDWTELHVTFRVDKPFAEGWSAYVHCAQEGARFRADRFRLYEGPYVPRGASAEGDAAEKPSENNLFANPSFEDAAEPWFFTYRTEQRSLKRAYRRSCFLTARLLANMGVDGSTPLLDRFSTPVGASAGASVARNGDFSLDGDGDGMPDEWSFSSGSKRATCERVRDGAAGYSLRIACPPAEGNDKPSVMLAQYGVPVREGQWYRFSFRARAEAPAADSVTVTITNTATWHSLFDYQRFTPEPEWKPFRFDLRAKGTADERTRLQIWYNGPGNLSLADLRVEPIDDPTEGRWLEGLYLDVPQEWDDPYRFFRW